MLFSPPCEYAIRALTYLAGRDPAKPVSVAVIAEHADIPSRFLSKILLTLKNNHLLKATKGPGGGYRLAMPAAEIRLKDIANAVNTPREQEKRCVLGLDMCSDSHPCPLHMEWKHFQDDMDDKIRYLTVAELHDKLNEKRAHLKNKS